MSFSKFARVALSTAVSAALIHPASAAIRVMTYNVDADTDRDGDNNLTPADGTYNAALVANVVKAVSKYKLAGNTQAPDVISLQELYYTPSVTLAAVVNNLNTAFAGTGVTYAYDSTVTGQSTGNTAGNGQNGLIYRTGTIKVLDAAVIGSASGSAAARTPIRYQLQATGFTGTNTFYLYDEHTKASQGTAEAGRRAIETAAVRSDANSVVSANPTAHVLYSGDFNLAGSTDNTSTSGSNEQAYKNLVAAGTAAQAVDPLVSSFTNYSSSLTNLYTEADDSLSRRYDLLLQTANVSAASAAAGLQLVANTYTAFGGSYYSNGALTSAVATGGTVATTANATATGIALADLQNLVATTDHLPVIADYTIAVPEPGAAVLIGIAVIGLRRRARRAA